MSSRKCITSYGSYSFDILIITILNRNDLQDSFSKPILEMNGPTGFHSKRYGVQIYVLFGTYFFLLFLSTTCQISVISCLYFF